MAIGGPCDDANGNGVPDVADQIIDYISEAQQSLCNDAPQQQ
jgi:hypothetical protein